MMRKNSISWIFTTAIALGLTAGCEVSGWGPAVKGSGTSKVEQRSPGEFSAVEVSGPFDVEVTVGQPGNVTLSGDDNIVTLVETRLEGSTLHIDSRESFSTSLPLKIDIATHKLSGLSMTGSGHLHATQVSAERFDAKVTGSGEVSAAGTASSLDAHVTGSGDLQLKDLVVQDAKADVTGSGDVTLNAVKSLDAHVTGSGDVRYVGNTGLKVQSNVTGSGNVRAQ